MVFKKLTEFGYLFHSKRLKYHNFKKKFLFTRISIFTTANKYSKSD